ncbi:lysophospholipid acyltransferase family protein [Canibacter zhoujuaniae]|uniref:lysophospholipid acyltransferase family protein n=1 Tax=Canibacter zhoujuaniae TaxID=2708343 RepID=UPI001FB9F79E|nr:lysophospholipid acyltransferase family protein [Canibacter zhoujuaniae]
MNERAQHEVELVRFKRRRTPETTKFGPFRIIAAIVLPLWQFAAKYRFAPNSKLPAQGPFVLAPNHLSEIDPIAMAVAVFKLGRLPRFMAKASLFKVPFLKWILKITGQIPVYREANSGDAGAAGARHSAMQAASHLIATSGGVIVYPEGTLTRDPDMWPMRGKSGAARLALEGNIPLIPAAHWGVQEIMPRYGKKLNLFGRKTVRVAIGEPLDLSEYQGRPINNAVIGEVTDKLMAEITALLETLRGEEAPTKRWDPREHEQSETGRF